MGKQVPPIPQLEFHGVNDSGNPIHRPAHTAAKCLDFRVMPGYWLRTAGGRKARYNTAGTSIRRIVPFRDPALSGSTTHLMQIDNAANLNQWNIFSAGVYVPSVVETISGVYDSNYSSTNPAAASVVVDRCVLYNGLGVRDNTSSRPALSVYAFSFAQILYYGLDAWCPSGTNPTVAFAAGAGLNQILFGVTIYVGLFNIATGHYSNAVKAGTIAATGATGTITVSNLARLSTAIHNVVEQNNLKYVFYATVDATGSQVPYLILNSTLDNPFFVASTSTSASLSISASPTTPGGPSSGWVLDLTKESPFQNFPPRPMRSVCFQNGRLYGALLQGGSDGVVLNPDFANFSYVPLVKDLAAVVWSQAASDTARQNVLGDALQCWPATNILYTPSSDVPVAVVPAQDTTSVLVLTPSSSFLLREVTDGIHAYIPLSRQIGCGSSASVVQTMYGICWTTQRNEAVMLLPNSTTIVPLSRSYQSLIPPTAKVTAADWVYDAAEQIDRYQMWLDNGTSVIHDFALGDGSPGSGEAYSRTAQGAVTAAATCLDSNSVPHFILATSGIYTHETQPDTRLIPTTDQTFTTPGAQTIATTEISGEYDRNWDNLGDTTKRKELPFTYVIGDGNASVQLGASPLTVEWYKDLQQVTGANKKTTTLIKSPQSGSDYSFMAKFSGYNAYWFKMVLKIAGHSTDDATFLYHQPVNTQGDLAKNFYGSLLEFLMEVAISDNRP